MGKESYNNLDNDMYGLGGLPISFVECSRNPNILQIHSSLAVENHDSDLLISLDNSFTCGFYGLGENAYYLSIWFTNSKDRRVVWTANPDKPVNGKGSRISLLRNGALVLTDIDGAIAWETNTSNTNVGRAELLDNGNLVLKDSSGKILWQSFDFPTDTLLPHQHFTKSNKLISRLGRGNYAAGNFIFHFDNDNVLRLMYDGPDISSVYWPNIDFDVFQNLRTNYNSTRIAVLDDMGRFLSSDRLDFNASDFGFGIKRRLTMDYDGNLRLYSLNNATGLWTITWEAVRQMCSVHGICGRNGICVYQPEPKCSCPPGYEMADQSNWNRGCKPRFSRFCSMPQMQSSFESCKNKCLEDCQCQAFSYRLTGEGTCYTKPELFNGYKSPNFPELVKGIRLSNWVVEDGEEHETTELTKFVKVVKRIIQSEDLGWIESEVDTRLNGAFSRRQAQKMVEIGVACVEEDRSKRPTMDSIVQALLECEE
ncbi:S-locus glycoprotein [Corchorus olitorius]|uniref:non-specific serine/threonine protein kinase n=1 Tax=Corchorus olitorius TaxID=93759 RepID=A0A1R3HV73_9ROSI|nr:S-locus glycoprotein [Corchorus olitorius]